VVIVGSHLRHQPVLNIEKDFSVVSVVLDQNVERIAVRHPSKKTRVRRQGNDSVLLNVKVSLETFRIDGKQSVDESEQLHNSLVLSKILVT